MSARYFDLIREMKQNTYNHRLRLVESAKERGILAKAHTYQLYFNLVRPNSHKENQSPWQIIERLAPRSPLELCLLPPVFLDYHLNDSGGYDVPRHPYDCHRQVVGQFEFS